MYLFILGRQPEIGLVELRAVFNQAELILPQVALVSSDKTPDIDRLGGVRKVGRVIYDNVGNPGQFLLDKFRDIPSGKITIGISHYGKTASATNAQKTAMFLKKNLERSVRILPNSESEISDAATLGNKLGSSPNKIELLMAHVGHHLIIAELIGVQDLNSYTLRDRGRPKRDPRVGMLPPKLAQIMMNLALGISSFRDFNFEDFSPSESETYIPDDTDRFVRKDGSAGCPAYDVSETDGSEKLKSRKLRLLDPFCGTGVVLQEAALMGFGVYGTDIEPRMIDYTRTNLNWLAKQKTFELSNSPTFELTVADATNCTWTSPIDLVATETYLGQPYTTTPPSEKLQQNITTCNTVISKFLLNLASQITPGAGLCIAVPCWFLNNKTYHLPLTHQLNAYGYEQVFYSDDQKPLIYHREDQIVGRELLVLRKKS